MNILAYEVSTARGQGHLALAKLDHVLAVMEQVAQLAKFFATEETAGLAQPFRGYGEAAVIEELVTHGLDDVGCHLVVLSPSRHGDPTDGGGAIGDRSNLNIDLGGPPILQDRTFAGAVDKAGRSLRLKSQLRERLAYVDVGVLCAATQFPLYGSDDGHGAPLSAARCSKLTIRIVDRRDPTNELSCRHQTIGFRRGTSVQPVTLVSLYMVCSLRLSSCGFQACWLSRHSCWLVARPVR